MNISDIFKGGNKWYAIGAVLAIFLFFSSSMSLGIKAFIFGNPCAAGQVYNAEMGTCMNSASPVTCGAGQFLSYNAQKGYSCEWSNLGIGILLLAAATIIYFFFLSKKGANWIPAIDAIRFSFEKGHLQTKDGRNDFIAAWSHVEEVHQIKPHEAWLFVGDFVAPGRESSALILGTDKSGWVIRLWRYPLVDRQIQILMKKGMELDKALSEVAAYRTRTKAMVDKIDVEGED